MKLNNPGRSLKTWAIGLWMVVASLGTAQAQQVGTYEGVTEEGLPISIDVALDDAGQYVIRHANVAWRLQCPKTDSTLTLGMGTDGFDTPVNEDGHAALIYHDGNYYVSIIMNFKDDNTVAGRTRGAVPAFADDRTPPRSGQSCNAKNQQFTATFSSNETKAKPMNEARQVTLRIDARGRMIVAHSGPR